MKGAPHVVAEPEKPVKSLVGEVQVNQDKKFIEESKALEDFSTEDPIEKILREAEESRLNAERILNADSQSRAEQALISQKAKSEVQKCKAIKEGVADTKQQMNDFLEEFDRTAKQLAMAFVGQA